MGEVQQSRHFGAVKGHVLRFLPKKERFAAKVHHIRH
jgi:hypothetical protein